MKAINHLKISIELKSQQANIYPSQIYIANNNWTLASLRQHKTLSE
jgi:hypothetical protein